MQPRKKILYVDDDEAALNMVARHLIAGGYRVFTSSTPFVSPILEREHPDLIILDIAMPLLSGDKLAEILSPQLYADRIPIVFFSGIAASEVEAMTEQIPDSTFVAKESGLVELISRIDSILS